MDQSVAAESKVDWQKIVAKYQKTNTWKSIWQIVNTVVPFFALVILMYFSLPQNTGWHPATYLFTILLSVLTAGFLVRTFIIFHDAGHGSFFKSRLANNITGWLTGIFTLTPFHFWTHDHAIHHATHGDLDRRGHGDVWTLTVDEYLELPWQKKFAYRLYRNPLFMFGFGAFFNFLVIQRIPTRNMNRTDIISIMGTNVGLVGLLLLAHFTIGLTTLLLIYVPTMWIASIAGVFLFYVQHQFEDAYWESHDNWDFVDAAIRGSSYYKLPKVLQWFSGNIGFHHIHHLSPRIPNYNLEKCHNEEEIFHQAVTITLKTSLETLGYRIWDEDRKKLVGWKYIKVYQEKLEQQKAEAANAKIAPQGS